MDYRGTFDESSAPDHRSEIVRSTFGGRGRIGVERFALPWDFAQGLLQSLDAARSRLARAMGID
jgi:hypothetical protein